MKEGMGLGRAAVRRGLFRQLRDLSLPGRQGGRGKSNLRSTAEDDSADKGVWMSIWVDDVDAIHRHCVAQGLDVTMPPTDEPWGVREMHVRHPDGHVFRISRGTNEKEKAPG